MNKLDSSELGLASLHVGFATLHVGFATLRDIRARGCLECCLALQTGDHLQSLRWESRLCSTAFGKAGAATRKQGLLWKTGIRQQVL